MIGTILGGVFPLLEYSLLGWHRKPAFFFLTLVGIAWFILQTIQI